MRDPAKERWGRRARALVAGLMAEPAPLAMQADRAQARQALRSALEAYGAGRFRFPGDETGVVGFGEAWMWAVRDLPGRDGGAGGGPGERPTKRF
ncbi:hypothetical protein GCM10010250_65820 [Streptomyces althioticus]|nr:hypothetical protein GCM10010250_65820 [Streptomyces althioticus]